MATTERQKRFVDYFVETGNATEAARRAGYKGNNLNRIGSENLAKLDAEIKARIAEKDAARIASQDEVLQYLTAVMRGEETEEVVVVEGCGEGISEARRMDKALAGRDRIKAAELLGKRYLLFGERVDMAGDLQVVIDYDYGDDDAADTGGV